MRPRDVDRAELCGLVHEVHVEVEPVDPVAERRLHAVGATRRRGQVEAPVVAAPPAGRRPSRSRLRPARAGSALVPARRLADVEREDPVQQRRGRRGRRRGTSRASTTSITSPARGRRGSPRARRRSEPGASRRRNGPSGRRPATCVSCSAVRRSIASCTPPIRSSRRGARTGGRAVVRPLRLRDRALGFGESRQVPRAQRALARAHRGRRVALEDLRTAPALVPGSLQVVHVDVLADADRAGLFEDRPGLGDPGLAGSPAAAARPVAASASAEGAAGRDHVAGAEHLGVRAHPQQASRGAQPSDSTRASQANARRPSGVSAVAEDTCFVPRASSTLREHRHLAARGAERLGAGRAPPRVFATTTARVPGATPWRRGRAPRPARARPPAGRCPGRRRAPRAAPVATITRAASTSTSSSGRRAERRPSRRRSRRGAPGSSTPAVARLAIASFDRGAGHGTGPPHRSTPSSASRPVPSARRAAGRRQPCDPAPDHERVDAREPGAVSDAVHRGPAERPGPGRRRITVSASGHSHRGRTNTL